MMAIRLVLRPMLVFHRLLLQLRMEGLSETMLPGVVSLDIGDPRD
jgi:hypothetical protein